MLAESLLATLADIFPDISLRDKGFIEIKPEPQTHRNAAWAAVAVAVGLVGFILGGLAQ